MRIDRGISQPEPAQREEGDARIGLGQNAAGVGKPDSARSGRTTDGREVVQVKADAAASTDNRTTAGLLNALSAAAVEDSRAITQVEADGIATTSERMAATFLADLTAQYGERIVSAVAKQAGLDPASGKVDAQLAMQIGAMAETQRQVFTGINDGLAITCSAAGRTAAFRDACGHLGLAPERFDDASRRQVDFSLHEAIRTASNGNERPLDPDDGRSLLIEILARFAPPGNRPA